MASAASLPPHEHTIEPGEINRRGCRRCEIEAEQSSAARTSDAAPGDVRVLQWTCPHGTLYSGPMDFISGARNAHDELAGLEKRLRDVAAAWFEFRQSDLDALLHDYREDEDADA